MPACPLCGGAKARRRCPALDRVICPTCCGTKRETEIRCPPDCGWLRSARAHPHAARQRRQALDTQLILALVADLDDEAYAVLIACLQAALQHQTHAEPAPLDLDLQAAAASLAATAETATRGVLYEHRPSSPVAERLARAMSAPLAEAAEAGVPRLEIATLAAMRRLEQSVAAVRSQPGVTSAAYFEFLLRALTPRLADAETGADVSDDAGSLLGPSAGPAGDDGRPRIILP